MNSGEHIRSLLKLVADGQITESDARAAIETAEIGLYVDIDRMMRWLSTTGALTRDLEAEPSDDQSGAPFQSSIFVGSITMRGRTFGFGPGSFTQLLRDVFEQDEPFGLPGHTIADLCRTAGSKIKSVPVEYGFTCALAHCLEVRGDRAEARRLWEPYSLLTPRTWAPVEFESLFPELGVGESPRKLDENEKQAERALRSDIEKGRRGQNRQRKYLSLRALAMLHTETGHFDDALHCYDRALPLMEQFLESTGKLVLLGDLLWTAIWARQVLRQQQTVGALLRELELAPSYVANAAIFERSAMLCHMSGDLIAEREFLSRISPCLE